MITIGAFLVGSIAGFVGGVLFARKNKNTVENAVSVGKTFESGVKKL